IAVAPSDSNTVYAGTSNSRVQVTHDIGDGTGSTWADRSAGLPPRTVTQVAVDPLDGNTAYVTFSGFNGGSDTLGHVFKTNTSGGNWTDISGNLPNIPVNDVVIDPDMPQTLYLATDIGVMVTTDGGATWSTLGSGMPRVAVISLVLQRMGRVLRAASHGRSVWDILVPITGGPGVQPAIASISPPTMDAGSADFQLTVTGANFTSGTVIRWNGLARPTTFTDSGHVTAAIPATDIAAIGRAAITALNPVQGGGASNTLAFLIGPGPRSTANSAVSAANPLGGNNLSVRSIASVYGLSLATETQVADLAPPLPFALGGAVLTMLNGTQTIPLFFVSANQINFQVPFITAGAQQLTITTGSQSVTIPVNVVNYAPALFTTNAQGTGQASTTIANSASVAAPVGAFPGSRPAKIGEYISIYCTGLGPASNQPSLGSASPSSPLASTQAQPTVTIGGVNATVIFSGLAPGYVGLYQVNAQVPAGTPTGDAVPVVVTIGGVASNTATIAVDPAP
ncbi:MAG TPA: IPT/TIG domain-containing protein, partial [Candidatus Sulfopaludibacter sp.]|nr:IPT/TIG domain-containing protein [Candidatus Sulfopaludibacter sp.]